mmetsp:Transcript_1986/g.5502  ORF Transcript_1986/g.5502 Transcript_1986/m.5502 type:complete len:440 (-) Transcript_1986:71-1390(-)
MRIAAYCAYFNLVILLRSFLCVRLYRRTILPRGICVRDFLLFIFLFRISEQIRDFSTHRGTQEGRSQARRHEVQQCRLRRVELDHDEERRAHTQNVGGESRVEVRFGEGGVDVDILRGHLGHVGVESQQQGQEESRDDDVTQSQQGKIELAVVVGFQRSWEEDFDGSVEVLGHGDHDVGAEDPEDVVKEETHEEDGPDLVGSQRKALDALQTEADADDVVQRPVAFLEVVRDDDGGGGESHQIRGGELHPQVQRLRDQPIREGMGGNLEFPAQLLLVDTLGHHEGKHRREAHGEGPHTDQTEVAADEHVNELRSQVLDGEVERDEGHASHQRELVGILRPERLLGCCCCGVGIVPIIALLRRFLSQLQRCVAGGVEDGRDQKQEVDDVRDEDDLACTPQDDDQGVRSHDHHVHLAVALAAGICGGNGRCFGCAAIRHVD